MRILEADLIWEFRKWQRTPVFLPGQSQGRGSLVGYCLWGHTESDTTEVTQQQQQQQCCLLDQRVASYSPQLVSRVPIWRRESQHATGASAPQPLSPVRGPCQENYKYQYAAHPAALSALRAGWRLRTAGQRPGSRLSPGLAPRVPARRSGRRPATPPITLGGRSSWTPRPGVPLPREFRAAL